MERFEMSPFTNPEAKLIPVTKWESIFGWPSEKTLRHFIFWGEQNGFSKVVRRVGRKVLIHRDEFFLWIEEVNNKKFKFSKKSS
jgi:hypothetical protein